MGRGPTAYFMYADSVRAAVKAALVAGADPDAPNPGVATVAKAIGVQWKALTDEGRAEWKAKAAAAIKLWNKLVARCWLDLCAAVRPKSPYSGRQFPSCQQRCHRAVRTPHRVARCNLASCRVQQPLAVL